MSPFYHHTHCSISRYAQSLHGALILCIMSAVDRWWQVLEYLPGGDFFSFMNDRAEGLHEGHGEAISEDHAKVYGAELVLALGHLHTHGIVYRDLKPENVLMDR